MRKFVYVAMFFVILSFFGCSSSTSNNEDNVQPCINCGITFKALLAKNYPNQIHVDYRSYFTAGSKMSRGTLYARFCSDAACETELTREVVGEDVLLSTGTEQDFSITSAPLGASYIQLGFFTDYASEHLGEPFLQFTVLQTEAATIEANNDEAGDPSTNPEASALSVNISNGNNQDLGTLMLGHIVFNIPVEPTVGEDPKEVWVPAGEEDERTHLDIIREGDGEITEELDPPILEGSEFLGDLCGAVAANDAIYAVAVGLNGAYLFEYDSETHIQTHEHAAFISHPDSDCQEDDPDCFAEAPAEELNVDTFPRPCTGTVVDQNDRRLVYLTRDANDDSTSTSDRLVGIDVTDLSDGTATTVETGSKIDNSLAIRNMAIDSDSLYLTAAGWGNDDSKTRILKYDIPSSDTGTDQLVTTFATAEEIGADCGCASRYTPGTIVATHNCERRLFVGNDDSISVIDVATREEIGQIDITDYGRGITDFALSPDGHTLYAVPACEDRKSVV